MGWLLRVVGVVEVVGVLDVVCDVESQDEVKSVCVGKVVVKITSAVMGVRTVDVTTLPIECGRVNWELVDTQIQENGLAWYRRYYRTDSRRVASSIEDIQTYGREDSLSGRWVCDDLDAGAGRD